MAKKILGIDIGHDRLKLALVKGNRVKKTVVAAVPKQLVKEGRVVSVESMGELIRTTMRENGIHCSRAALALPNDVVFVRSATTPVMNHDQLMYNLPYEFRDYITDELTNYVFDYAVTSTPQELAEEKPKGEAEESPDATPAMELLTVAVPKTLMEESKEVLRKAGLKMVKAAPALCAYIPLIRDLDKSYQPETGEYCILDLGYRAIRMYMFHGTRHTVTRVLETGLSALDVALSEAYGVDEHLAHTYLLTNYENCQYKDVCMNAYNNIAVEMLRALNFYRFSNPDSRLADAWLCGGANIAPLRDAIASTLDMNLHDGAELVRNGSRIENCNALVQAIGITQE